MNDHKFNPIPLHAPEFRTNLAHYTYVSHTDKSGGPKKDQDKAGARYYWFSIGNSDKIYKFQDKYLDDSAMEMLEHAKRENKRLVLKGYISPSFGNTFFAILTHFAIWYEDKPSYKVVNPETGEVGDFYKLNTKLQDVNEHTETY